MLELKQLSKSFDGRFAVDSVSFSLEKGEKVPALRNQQGAFIVYGSQDQVLKRGHDIRTVLKVFETRRFEVISSSRS